MKLKQIKLFNFRQFKAATIDFAEGSRANITLIHGEMGHGKTALLNAFRWVLHGRNGVKRTLTDPGYIVNSQLAELDINTEAKVLLTFDRNVEDVGNLHVVLERTISASDQNIEQRSAGRIKVKITNLTNPAVGIENLESASAQNFINAILPEGILDILFFDGEGVDKLVAEKNEQLVEAVRTILGFSVIEAAVADLYAAKKYFEAKRKQGAGDALGRKIEAIDMMKADRERHRANVNDFKNRIATLEARREEHENELTRFDEVRQLVERKIRLRTQVEERKKLLGETYNELRTFLRKNAFSLVSVRLSNVGIRLEKEFRDKGDFPAPISRDFVQELINKQVCICGSTLCAGSTTLQKVQGFLKVARDSKFHESAASVGLALRDLHGKRLENINELKRLRSLYLSTNGDITEYEEEIRSLEVEIGSDSKVDIVKLQKLSYDIGREIGKLDNDIRDAVENLIPKLNADIYKQERELAVLEARQRETQIAGRRVALIQAAIDKLTASITSATERLEDILNDSVDSAFSLLTNIEGKAKVARISSGPGKLDTFVPYVLVRGSDNSWVREFGMNRGRQQCLSLALIKSLVSIAANPSCFSDDELTVFTPQIYPIVVDAPFGVLTEDPALRLAKDMPNFANQVVCLINHASYALVAAELDTPTAVGRKFYIYHNFNSLGTDAVSNKRISGIDVQVSGPSQGGTPSIYSEIIELNR